METLFIYGFKVLASMMLFYLLHMIFFRKETFLKLRRVYFLSALFFSLFFPFINLTFLGIENHFEGIPLFNLAEVVIVAQQPTQAGEILAGAERQIDILTIITIIASIGSIILLSRFLLQLFSLSKIIYQAKKIEYGGKINILETNNPHISTFSFFGWIVLHKDDINESNFADILEHEKTHIKQLHSVDIMLYELLCIVFWWNPFAWLMKNEVKLNLEYLADAYVINNRSSYREYQYTLLQISIANTGMAFINNFNVSHLKKRIIMMNKKRSPILAMAKYLLIAPLALALLYMNTGQAKAKGNPEKSVEMQKSETTSQKDKDPVFEIVEEMPEYPGGDAAMMRFIGENLKYPIAAQKAEAEGRVIVRFVIRPDGSITDCYILRNTAELGNKLNEIVVVGYGKDNKEEKQTITLKEAQEVMDKECIRVIESMPKWKPGKQNGKEVSVYFNLPVLFRLK